MHEAATQTGAVLDDLVSAYESDDGRTHILLKCKQDAAKVLQSSALTGTALNAETQDNADGRHVEGTSEHGRCVPSAYVDSGLALVIAAGFNLNKSEQAQILATATR